MNRKDIGLSLNFDWISSVFDISELTNIDEIDKALCHETDEILNYILNKGGKVSIFIIGSDLLRPVIKQYVKKWAKDGHEIGNHTWSHPVNFGNLPKEKIEKELSLTENIILETIGKNSTGFISPSWSSSKTTFNSLIDQGFKYDHSVMPSFQNIIFRFLMSINSKTRKESFLEILSFKLLYFNFLQPSKAYKICKGEKNIIQIPLPSLFRLFSYWYTPELLIKGFKKRRKLFLQKPLSYVLFHPADFCSFDLIENQKHLFPQSKIKDEIRKSTFINFLDQLIEENYKFTTMKDLAFLINEKDLKSRMI